MDARQIKHIDLPWRGVAKLQSSQRIIEVADASTKAAASAVKTGTHVAEAKSLDLPDLKRWFLDPEWNLALRFDGTTVRRYAAPIFEKFLARHIPRPIFSSAREDHVFVVLDQLGWNDIATADLQLLAGFQMLCDIQEDVKTIRTARLPEKCGLTVSSSDVAQGSSIERLIYWTRPGQIPSQLTPSVHDESVLVDRNCHFPSATQRFRSGESSVLIIVFAGNMRDTSIPKNWLAMYSTYSKHEIISLTTLFQKLRDIKMRAPMHTRPAGTVKLPEHMEPEHLRTFVEAALSAAVADFESLKPDKIADYLANVAMMIDASPITACAMVAKMTTTIESDGVARRLLREAASKHAGGEFAGLLMSASQTRNNMDIMAASDASTAIAILFSMQNRAYFLGAATAD
eukprot:6461892-Amphidinium_carterae.1